ncbi:MAG: radical SAM protein [Candidatus Aminicenantes bacterium]|nr:radical SAM protein [Candidatus Aminicenantes bacterium]
MKRKTVIRVYGPVPSRRLGYSLGVDILPFKTCTLDCVYCQLGPTTNLTAERKKFMDCLPILEQIRDSIDSKKRIDYITFSGSGEPTLNTELKKCIRHIKSFTDIPVAVLTNATLLGRASVRKALIEADLVVPSLDAAEQSVFEKTNRPHPSLRIKEIILGLEKFREIFKGKIWLEVMLVKGFNDSPEHVKKLKEAVEKICPDKVQLNTVVRPPAEETARPLNREELESICRQWGDLCEVIADFKKLRQKVLSIDITSEVLAMVRRRPVTLDDLSVSLGKHKNEIIKHLNALLDDKKIKTREHKGNTYYEPV